MKVLIVTGIFPPDIGGPASYVPRIARALGERNHQVQVLTTSEPEHMEHADDYPFPVMRMNRRVHLYRRSFHWAGEIMRRGRNADVIFANGAFEETVIASRWLRKPLVIKIVGDEAWERATNKGWTRDGFDAFQVRRQAPRIELMKRVRSWYARSADAVIVPSEYLKRIILGWGVASQRCHVVYNAVDKIEAVTMPTGGPPRPANDAVRLLTVGRLVPWKGVDKLIRLMPRLEGATLTVVGDGPCRAEWQGLASKCRITDRVRFAGAVARQEMPAVMAQHDVFVLASTYEGLPHVVVEAMRAGLPIVATPAGGTPEVVEDGLNGLLAGMDELSMLHALSRIIGDEALRLRLGRQASMANRERFNAKTLIEQTDAVLQATRRCPAFR